MLVNYKKINPNGFYLLKYFNDSLIRFIIMFGGSSSGKSFSVAQSVLIQTLLDGENTLVMRKVGASISKTIYEDFKVASKGLGIFEVFTFTQNCIKCCNGAKIDFSGLDDPEKIKGISNYKRVLLEEMSEFDEPDYKQIRKRLRGKKGQQIISTFNPISEMHWIKKNVLDKENLHDIPMRVEINGKLIPEELTKVKSLRMNEAKYIMNPRTGEIEEHAPDMIVIQSTYLNNFWVVGSPDGTYGYYDEQCVADFERDRINDPDYYNVYALGEWGILRTGSEFLGSFNIGKHSGKTEYNPNLPIHMSVDNNVLPYISIQYWQADLSDGVHMYQFAETCASSPNNTVKKAGKMVIDYLRSIRYSDKIYLHGDASTKAANTIDEEKRSWLDLFIDTLQKGGFEIEDKVGNKNPSVSMTGEFINAIFDESIPGISVFVGENCRNSIDDYLSVQKDVNGAILKTKIKNKVTNQSYEEHGHLTDCLRYVVHDLCYDSYTTFSNRRKRNLYASDSFIHFYNPKKMYSYGHKINYVMPNVNNKFIMVQGCQFGGMWHITEVIYKDSIQIGDMNKLMTAYSDGLFIVECSESYFRFGREMRDSGKTVRIMKEYGDMHTRIMATSDFVSKRVLFNEEMNDEYTMFLDNLMDYNRDSDNIESSSVLSGFASYVVKLSSE